MGIAHECLPHNVIPKEFMRQIMLLEEKNDGLENLAVVSLDFDNFNYINDLFSFDVGSAVLTRLIKHFSDQLNDGELFTRLYADHFAFLVKIIDSEEQLAERFLEITNTKEVLSDVLPKHYTLVSSGGIVSINNYKDSLATILDRAHFARKEAKGHYTNTFVQYDLKMAEQLRWRKNVTIMMEASLEENEFEMYLQPKVIIETGEIVGAEALSRWNNKKYGLIYPDWFIPIMEQNGFVKQLDFYILKQACEFLKKSKQSGIKSLPISVNFSKTHIQCKDFVEKIAKIVNEYDLPTEMIQIEFTENVCLKDFTILSEIITDLKSLGFVVALDDFGSAYSSLNYLKNMPLDIIKIDKGFLDATINDDKGRIIVAKTVEMINELNIVSLMEGVETFAQAEVLKEFGCVLGQGHLYAKAMPADEYMELIKERAYL